MNVHRPLHPSISPRPPAPKENSLSEPWYWLQVNTYLPIYLSTIYLSVPWCTLRGYASLLFVCETSSGRVENMSPSINVVADVQWVYLWVGRVALVHHQIPLSGKNTLWCVPLFSNIAYMYVITYTVNSIGVRPPHTKECEGLGMGQYAEYIRSSLEPFTGLHSTFQV